MNDRRPMTESKSKEEKIKAFVGKEATLPARVGERESLEREERKTITVTRKLPYPHLKSDTLET